MTTDIRSTLATCVENPPNDLLALYTSPFPNDPELCTRILPLSEAVEYTKAIQRTLLGRPLGLFALDDANDSNPFCYITRGPAQGCILHLSHDGNSAVEYSSLGRFLAALKSAQDDGLYIDELPGKDLRPAIDQQSLVDRLAELVQQDTDEAECELVVLARLLDTNRVEAVRSLSLHSSFFVREAVALLIASHPNTQLLAVAESLAKDRHSQVSQPGRKALAAVKQLAAHG